MLIKCPECELQVSDKAISCPHCGLPFKPEKISANKKPKKNHKRLPNGFGQISELKGQNLRKPFRAMVTIGVRENGHPISSILKPEGYFATYNEAYEALMEYNKNPYDLKTDITVKELYERWSEEYFKTLNSDSSKRTVSAAWNYCSAVYSMRAKDIRARHIKDCMENGIAVVNNEQRHTTPNMQGRIKSLFNLMLDYAVEYELVDRNYSRTFDVSDDVIKEAEETKRDHLVFTNDEMDLLWKNISNIQYVDLILFQCYSGWRPQELVLLKLENINFETRMMLGGMKSDAGIERYVPIHPRIYPIVQKYYNEAVSLNSKYLVNCTDTYRSIKMTYDKYRSRFGKIIAQLNMDPNHRPHDPRKQFVTMCKKSGMDDYALKYIVGHKINDVTEKIYTQRDPSWYLEQIMNIDYK